MPRESSKQMEEVARAVQDRLPDGYGFVVLAFPFTGTGGPEADVLRYVSNAQREDVVNVLKEFLIRAGHADDWIKHHD